MASGMGMPSIGISSYELFNAYNVENIIRIDFIISIEEDAYLKYIVIATSISTNSNGGKNSILDWDLYSNYHKYFFGKESNKWIRE